MLLALIRALAIAGTPLRLRNGPLYQRVPILLYVAMSWMGLARGLPLYQEIAGASILLMLAGRHSYSGGLPLYRWHHPPFNSCLW